MLSDRLRVLFILRPDASQRLGGDTTFARDMFAAVRALGVAADCVESDRPDPRGYDIAHVFNVGDPEVCARQIGACIAADVPVALSPVWLDLCEHYGRAQAYERVLLLSRTQDAALAKLRRYARAGNDDFLDRRQRATISRRLALQRELLSAARVLLPNSAIEAHDCLVKLGVRDLPLVVVRIAADLEPADYWKSERYGLVSVGRLETRKNQTALVFAMRNDPIKIDIVGAIKDPDPPAICRRWNQRATLHGAVSRSTVLDILGRAEVHALVSWCETAGIATMEAAIAGAKIVVADRGAEIEYFGDDAEYADPADPDSIRAAVFRAFSRPPRYRGDHLDQRIRGYTWRRAAEETMRAYEIALAKVPASRMEEFGAASKRLQA